MRQTLRFLIVLLLFLFVQNLPLQAQDRYLVLDKPGKVKRLRFRVGDEIALKLKNDKRVYREVITNVTDTSIVIMSTDVPLANIRAIVFRKEAGLARSAVYILPRAGIIYLLAATFNPVFRGDSPDFAWNNVVVSGIIGGSSLLFVPLLQRTYRINNFRRLRTLQEY